jgi:hypothetical protein
MLHAHRVGRGVNVELARQQWEEGRRRIEAARSADPAAYRRLASQVDLVADELRKRVGQTFTLAELTDAYAHADDWARDLLFDAAERAEAPPPNVSVVADAAFHRYARGASDYVP